MKTFRIEVPLRWGDMDAMAHINNVAYFRLMEQARIQWFEQFGFATLPNEGAPILAHCSCDFVRALNYPGVAVIEQTVTRVGRTSLDLNITIGRSDEPDVIYATGRSVLVWYDYQAGRSVPWPESIRAAIS